MPEKLHLILSTCSPEAAGPLAHRLVSSGRAACVNILPGVQSIYQWQDQIHQDAEVLMIIKTAWPDLPELFDWLAAEHPYEVPEIISLPGDQILPSYLQWAIEQSGHKRDN